MVEICICSAVKTTTGQIVRGHRHGDCIKTIVAMNLKPSHSPKAQGFITSKNRFVDREHGRKLQDKANIKSVAPDGYMGDTLFSEDLYGEGREFVKWQDDMKVELSLQDQDQTLKVFLSQLRSTQPKEKK